MSLDRLLSTLPREIRDLNTHENIRPPKWRMRVKLFATLATVFATAFYANAYEPDLPGGGGPSNQPNPPSVELEKRQGAEHRLQAFGPDLLGDGIDPNTGTIQFEVTDVSLPGNFNLPVSITRKISQGRFYNRTVSAEFGDWQIVAPRLHALTRTGHDWTGNRCTNTFAQSFPAHVMRQGTTWYRHQYTDGFNMVIPGEGSKTVLEWTGGSGGLWPSNTQFTTVDGWRLTCGSATNGQGFIGHSPDGTTYRFDKVFTIAADEMGNKMGGGLEMLRTRNIIAASLVTDVHGNTVNYDYDSSGRLTAIRASDDRRINLNYSGASKLISSVTANPGTSDARTWTYSYAQRTFPEIYNYGTIPSSLIQVTQPDSLSWSYNMAGMSASPGMGFQCPQTTQTVSATHPHGVTGEFRIGQTYQRSSYHLQETKSYNCPGMNEVTPSGPPQWQMKRASIMSVGRKTLSAPGMTSQEWNFLYEYDSGAPNSSGSDRTNWTSATDPGGIKTLYRHYWQAEAMGGKAASVEILDGSTVVQRTDYSYQQEGSFGGSLVNSNSTVASSTSPTHTISTVLSRDGSNYTTSKTFNTDRTSPATYSWSKPVTIVTDPDFGTTNTRTTALTYEHDYTKWLIGRVKTTSYQGAAWENLTYDSFGRVSQYRRHGDLLGAYTYHTATGRKGALNTYTNALSHVVTVPSYMRGTPTRVDRPDGTYILQTVDRNGWVTSTRDGRGNVTNYGNDTMGRLTLIDRPDSWLSTSINYNFSSPGAVQTVNKGNARTTVTYDPMFRETLLRSQALDTGWSSYVKMSYDSLNRKTFASLPSTSSNPTQGTNYTYDALSRPVQTAENVLPYATTTTAYLAQNAVRVTDAEGKITTTYRQGHAGPGKGEVTQIVQPMGVNTVLHRDNYGRVERVQQYGNHNGYNLDLSQYYYFDPKHRVCRSRTPEGGDTLSAYNIAGQLMSYSKGHTSGTACTAPTGTSKVTLTYDTMGRPLVTNFTDSATPDIVRTYDNDGNLLTINRGSGGMAINWAYAWNSLSLPTTETLTVDSRTYGLSYLYNTTGQMTRKTLPSARQVNYTPDGLGRALTVKNGAATLSSGSNFHVSGSLASMSLSNGHTYSQTFTPRYQPLRVRTYKSGVTAIDQTFSYDDVGRILGVTDAADSANSRTYAYDDLGRLTSASGPWGSGSYLYDPLGNLRSKTLGARSVTLSYDATRNRMNQSADTGGSGMASTGTRTVAYDGRGNVTTLGTLGFLYDMADQPRAVSGASNGTYRYDGHLRRVKAIVDGATVYNIFDLSGSLVHIDKLAGGGQTAGETDYVSGPSGTLARITDNVVTFLHNDPVGSASAGTSASGAMLWTERYTPFGEAMLKPSTNDDLGGYTGHIRDVATGLNYMQARYQDPVSGRFLSVDPVTFLDTGLPGQFNRYAYTWNDPINANDPDGELINFVIGAVIGAAIETGSQLIANRGDFSSLDAGAIGKSAAIGSLTGGVGGALGKAALTKVAPQVAAKANTAFGSIKASAAQGALEGGIGAGVGDVANQLTDGNAGVNLSQTAGAVASGAALGAVSGGASQVGTNTSVKAQGLIEPTAANLSKPGLRGPFPGAGSGATAGAAAGAAVATGTGIATERREEMGQ